jgi:hypothetical protein
MIRDRSLMPIVGSLLSGALQSAIQRSLNGSQGMPGWRWMFVSLSVQNSP